MVLVYDMIMTSSFYFITYVYYDCVGLFVYVQCTCTWKYSNVSTCIYVHTHMCSGYVFTGTDDANIFSMKAVTGPDPEMTALLQSRLIPNAFCVVQKDQAPPLTKQSTRKSECSCAKKIHVHVHVCPSQARMSTLYM